MLHHSTPFRSLVLAALALGVLAGCKKESDEPPPAGLSTTTPATPSARTEEVKIKKHTKVRGKKIADPDTARVNKNANTGIPDSVRWENKTEETVRLLFTAGWPFKDPPKEIVLRKGEQSEKFPIRGDASRVPYPYEITPGPPPGTKADTGPPGDPAVLVGG